MPEISNSIADTMIDYQALRGSYQHVKLCKCCGTPFVSQRSNHVFCSRSCVQRVYWLRKQAKAKLTEVQDE